MQLKPHSANFPDYRREHTPSRVHSMLLAPKKVRYTKSGTVPSTAELSRVTAELVHEAYMTRP